MKVTPIDIRHKEFRRSMRGYSEEEVDVFLDEVADDFELLFKENMELKDQIHRLKEQVAQYETLKETLQKTLISAQQQADETRANARKEAELILRDAELKARNNIAESYTEKQKVQQSVVQLRQLEDDFRFKFKSLLEAHLNLLMEDEASDDRRRLRGIAASSADEADDKAASRPAIQAGERAPEKTPEARNAVADTPAPVSAPAAGDSEVPAAAVPAAAKPAVVPAAAAPVPAADSVASATVKMPALDDSTLDAPPLMPTEPPAPSAAFAPPRPDSNSRPADQQASTEEPAGERPPAERSPVEQPPAWLKMTAGPAQNVAPAGRPPAERAVPAQEVATRIIRRPIAPDSPRVETAGPVRPVERSVGGPAQKRGVDDELADFDDFDFDFDLDEPEDKAAPSGRDGGKRESGVRRFLFGPKNQSRNSRDRERDQGDDRDFDW